MLRAGITGGIGSGKSLVASIFTSLGVPVFSADAEAAAISNHDPGVIHTFKELFGDSIIDDKGFPNRKKLRKLVFQDDEARLKINRVIHPLVKKRFDEWCLEQNKAPLVIKEAAILFESGANEGLEFVMVVTAPEELRISRVMLRDGVREEGVRAIMANQMKEEERIKRADFVFVNDESTLLVPQVLKVFKSLLEISQQRKNGV